MGTEMYISNDRLSRRAADLERFARRQGLDLGALPPADRPAARIGRIATRLGIDLVRAFDLDRELTDPARAN